MYDSDVYLTELLKTYYRLEKEQRAELLGLPEGQLTVRREKGRIQYVRVFSNPEKRKPIRKGITRDPEMIHALARKKFLQQSLAQLEINILALEALLKVHQAPTPNNILKQLPTSLRGLSPYLFLPEHKSRDQWEKEDFEQDPSRQESRTHITSRGLMVRSKSEVIIADRLDFYGIPFRYEQVIYIENQRFSPDFTVWRSDGLVYWEHCGLVSDPTYMKHHKWKLSIYEKAGIVPWKNLIVTYDDEYGNLNVRRIDMEIRTRLL